MAERADEFYVGYLPNAPAGLARFTRRIVFCAIALALCLCALLVAAQQGFSYGVFEFGERRDFEGRVEFAPYPVLAVERPGAGSSRYLLTAFGKHGADELLRDFQGRRVRLSGTLVYRECMTMIEVAEGSITPLEGVAREVDAEERLNEATLIGEIVDSKCYLGVMKPGDTKPHRDCAVRCISGGVPPLLLVRDERGNAAYYVLSGAQGESIGKQLLDFVAEPIEVTGIAWRRGDMLQLRIDPASIVRR